jgi:hypothetical protein
VKHPQIELNAPEDDRWKRAGKAKKEARYSGTKNAAKEYGLSAYFVRKTAPLEYSERLRSKIQGRLSTLSAMYGRMENRRDVLLALRSIRPFFRHHQRLGAHGQAETIITDNRCDRN